MNSSDSHSSAPLLIGRHRHAPVAGVARVNGDEIFLLRQPVVHVDEQVGVALNAGGRVRGEVGIADDHDAHLRLRRRFCRSRRLFTFSGLGRSSGGSRGGASGASIDSDSAIVIGPR